MFGNESQEKEFVVTGGLLWYNDFLIIGKKRLSKKKDTTVILNNSRSRSCTHLYLKLWKEEKNIFHTYKCHSSEIMIIEYIDKRLKN